MSRSANKGPFIDERLLRRVLAVMAGDRTPIRTYARASSISPEMVGKVISIHTGRRFADILITEEMVGHKLGEFAATKQFIRHGGRLQREAEAAATIAEKPVEEAAK